MSVQCKYTLFTNAMFIDRSKFREQFLKRVTKGTFLWNYFKIWPVVSEKIFKISQTILEKGHSRKISVKSFLTSGFGDFL